VLEGRGRADGTPGCRDEASGRIVITGLAPGGPAAASSRVQVGDALVCLTNTKPHPITAQTDVEYVKRKIAGQPRSTCRLTLVRNGAKFDVLLTRGGFSQPVEAAAEGRAPSTAPSGGSEADRLSVASSSSAATSRASGDVTCGVGLLPAKDAQGSIVVAGIAPGGPAHLSGQVMVGDVILCLKNKKEHVLDRQTSLEYVKRKMKGYAGSVCTLTLLRSSASGVRGGQIQVALVRSRFAAPTSAAAPAHPTAALAAARGAADAPAAAGSSSAARGAPGPQAMPVKIAGRGVRGEARAATPRVQSIRLAAGKGALGAAAPYCGVGIEYVQDGRRGCVVTGIQSGSVAEEVGAVQVGDYLWKVDGKELKGLENAAIRALLQGPVGTQVCLSVGPSDSVPV
jgi:C-terminal processing protease CtpA/Prc